jgi:hypothetical protein
VEADGRLRAIQGLARGRGPVGGPDTVITSVAGAKACDGAGSFYTGDVHRLAEKM